MMERKAMKGSINRTVLGGLVMIMISFQVLAGAATVAQAPPAIFVFGDGALDVGNNNYLPGGGEMGDPPRANHSYYGIDFPNSQATGRFSNGYNMADFIAKSMGFGMSPPAYLSLSSPINMEGFTGVNYASADAGIGDPVSADMTIPFAKQVEYFAATGAQMKAKLGRRALRVLLSKSLFLIGVGTMDLLPDLFPTFPPKDNQTKVQHLINLYGASITSLYDMGARKFGIVNVGLIGCGPSVMERPYGDGGCDDSMNKLAREFNDALKSLLASLRSKQRRGLRYSLADFYAFSNATFADPAPAGFVNTRDACCRGPCTPEAVNYFGQPCGDRSQYWFWDEGYTTEQAAKLAAAAFYDGSAQFTAPVNFKLLIGKK